MWYDMKYSKEGSAEKHVYIFTFKLFKEMFTDHSRLFNIVEHIF
jgi:hypothetical protein